MTGCENWQALPEGLGLGTDSKVNRHVIPDYSSLTSCQNGGFYSEGHHHYISRNILKVWFSSFRLGDNTIMEGD